MLNKTRLETVIKNTDAKIVCASKYYDVEEIKEMYEAGIHSFGENRADAFLEKYQALKDYDIKWHFIGHLQTNKVKAIINKVDVLESLDSPHLAKYIDTYRIGTIECFIQVKLVPSKFGVKPEQVIAFLNELKAFKTIKVTGLMTILDIDNTDEEKYALFRSLVELRNELNNLGFKDIQEISAGMSNDYLLAIKAGASEVRLGRIFKEA